MLLVYASWTPYSPATDTHLCPDGWSRERAMQPMLLDCECRVICKYWRIYKCVDRVALSLFSVNSRGQNTSFMQPVWKGVLWRGAQPTGLVLTSHFQQRRDILQRGQPITYTIYNSACQSIYGESLVHCPERSHLSVRNLIMKSSGCVLTLLWWVESNWWNVTKVTWLIPLKYERDDKQMLRMSHVILIAEQRTRKGQVTTGQNSYTFIPQSSTYVLL